METMKLIEDGYAILSVKGTYKECSLYTYAKHVYAKVGGQSYVRLSSNLTTSRDGTTVLAISILFGRDDLGRVILEKAS